MAKLDEAFNAESVPEREDFSPIPPGAYNVMVVDSGLQETSKGGQMIVLELDIQDGDYAGRKLFDRLNIKNDNPKAVNIAMRTLAEIVKAVGKSSIKDTEELHNKRLTVNVSVEPAKSYKKDGVEHPGKPQNSVKRYLPFSGTFNQSAAKPAHTTEVTEKAPDSDANLPPWKRKKS